MECCLSVPSSVTVLKYSVPWWYNPWTFPGVQDRLLVKYCKKILLLMWVRLFSYPKLRKITFVHYLLCVKSDIELLTYLMCQHLWHKCQFPKKVPLRRWTVLCLYSNRTSKFYFIWDYLQLFSLLFSKHSLV